MRNFIMLSMLLGGGIALSACGEPEPVDPPPGMQQEMQGMQEPTQDAMQPQSAPGADVPSADEDPMNHPYGGEQQDQHE